MLFKKVKCPASKQKTTRTPYTPYNPSQRPRRVRRRPNHISGSGSCLGSVPEILFWQLSSKGPATVSLRQCSGSTSSVCPSKSSRLRGAADSLFDMIDFTRQQLQPFAPSPEQPETYELGPNLGYTNTMFKLTNCPKTYPDLRKGKPKG